MWDDLFWGKLSVILEIKSSPRWCIRTGNSSFGLTKTFCNHLSYALSAAI